MDAAEIIRLLDLRPHPCEGGYFRETYRSVDRVPGATGEKAYPISGMSFLVAYKKQPEARGKALKEFLHWATTDGQKFAEGLSYAPLPKALSEKLQPFIDSIELTK